MTYLLDFMFVQVDIFRSLFDFCVSFSMRLYEKSLWSRFGSSTLMASLFSKETRYYQISRVMTRTYKGVV